MRDGHCGQVVSVALTARRGLAKEPRPAVELRAGHGVEGDRHAGPTRQDTVGRRWHRGEPNLRQVHLLPEELLTELTGRGFDVGPGVLGENVLTRGLDLVRLPHGTRLALGTSAVVEVTGLRNPCVQLDRYAPGLVQAVLDRDADGRLLRRAGVLAVVVTGGRVTAGDAVSVALPDGEPVPLRAL